MGDGALGDLNESIGSSLIPERRGSKVHPSEPCQSIGFNSGFHAVTSKGKSMQPRKFRRIARLGKCG
jgi:hypothetical protein